MLFSKPTNGRAYTLINIPCGYCILCRTEQARQWAVRITHEAQLHMENSFITLTYSDENLPLYNSLSTNSSDKHPWQPPRDRQHLAKFFKRLRKRYGQLSYYAVGEYGDTTQRPHYHACIFGHAFADDRIILRREPSLLWTSAALEEAWGLGYVSVGALTFQTASYTASYVTKKLARKQQYVRVDEETGELIALVQPRAYMSLNPAIGKHWLNRYGEMVFAHDHVVIEGQRQKPPKYYDRWLEAKSGKRRLEKVKEKRIANATKLTSEQTRARARNAHARAKMKKKSV